MRITPLDIQKHRFRTKLRGYDPEEVRVFLVSFAEQYEAVVRENSQFREQVALLREQVREHEDRERILKDTLLAAQAAADDMRSAARREADILVKEGELKAERLMEVARDQISRFDARVMELKALRRDLVEKVRGMLVRQASVLAEWEEAEKADNVEFLDAKKAR